MNAKSLDDLSLLGLTTLLLRSPSSLTEGTDPRRTLARVTVPLLVLTVIGAGVFGAVVGSYRGGLQYLFAPLKLPLLLLVPLLVGLPAVRSLYRSCAVSVSHVQVVLAALVGTARAALLAATLGPFLWLLYSLHIDYHVAVLSMAGALLLTGGVGVVTMIGLLPRGGRHLWFAHLASVAVLGSLWAQSGWMLRPFVVRPRAEVTLVRPVESDIASSMLAAWRSARGDYRGWEAVPAGLLGRGDQEPSPPPVPATRTRVRTRSSEVAP